MRTVAQRLYDCIEDQDHSELITRNGITISIPDEDWLQAEFTFINTEDTWLSVIFNCELSAFVTHLGIISEHDIYLLTSGNLIELYYEGLAEMVCFIAIEYTYCMSFKKQGACTVAENERGIKHPISPYKKVATPDQFIAYALQYYKLMECSEN
jgi:hypothetical protein